MKIVLIAFLVILIAITVNANDSAVETSAGGLQLRKEHRVLMQKERLFIAANRVSVEYEFINNTSELVVSEVAFPIPQFGYFMDDTVGRRDFADFRAWIDNRPVPVKKEIRAFVHRKEVTQELRKAGITIETFGNFYPEESDNEIMKLRPDMKSMLVRIGALKAPDKSDNFMNYWPQWQVSVKYHWQQSFPPHSVVRVRHEYKPVSGYMPVQVQDLDKAVKGSCVDANALAGLKYKVTRAMKKDPDNNRHIGVSWVNYILTTANTWQTPIKDFELVVQGGKDGLVSFCWDGVIEKTSATTYRARKTNFVPEKDLKCYFMSVIR